jgi:hypothetical protein
MEVVTLVLDMTGDQASAVPARARSEVFRG